MPAVVSMKDGHKCVRGKKVNSSTVNVVNPSDNGELVGSEKSPDKRLLSVSRVSKAITADESE